MWLVYLRFNNDSQSNTKHVRCANKAEADYITNLAKQRGFTPESQLDEYGLFYSQRTIKVKDAPNFSNYDFHSFAKSWGVTEPPLLPAS